MKRILKILKFLFITLLVILALLISASLIFRGRITRIFTNEVNKHVETAIEVEKVGFSLLRGFPKATVEFKNIFIESPVSYDPWVDSVRSESNFLEAEWIYASFNVRDLIKKEYTIDRITLKNSKIFIYTDSLSSSTARIFKEKNSSDSSRISFKLKNIRIDNTEFKYLGNKKHFVLDCKIDNASGRLTLSEGKTEIQTKTGFDLNSISSARRDILRPIEDGWIDGDIVISPDSIYFKQLELIVDNQSLGIDGSLMQKDRALNLNITTSDSDLDRLMDYIPVGKGFSSGAKLGSLSLNLILRFGAPLESFSVHARSYMIEYAGNIYTGSFYIRNLLSPVLKLDINGDLDLAELHAMHGFPGIETISGTAHLNAQLKGSPGSFKDLGLEEMLRLDRRVNLNLSRVDLKLHKYEFPIQSIRGNVMIADHAWGDELSFILSGQNIVMNWKMDWINNLLLSDDSPIYITAGIWADRIDTGMLAPGKGKAEKGEINRFDETPASIEKARTGKPFQERLNASLTINTDSLIVDRFRCSQFDGVISYRPGFLNINSFNMLALNGSLSGNTALIRDSGGEYLARGLVDIENADINTAFKVFNNFGQEEMVAENIKGKLSGSVSISTRLDSSFMLNRSNLSLTGNYTITEGELINFEPLLKLSRFIEVKELEDIKFEKLHNDLIISDQKLLIPSMEINSSAFNISLSGEQDFSGDFEYHLQVLLSDILSKKAQKSGSYISEFGPVEDDGLGRTTLFLKLEKGDKGTNVSYDVKKLSEEIKVSLEQEKQSLKTILNEEYGWYNSDSLSNTNKSSSRKFRITWEEADSVKTITKPVETGRTGLFKKIFKSDTTKKKL